MSERSGIILAGGLGTRLRPLTLAVSKQLLPICDKPMIYYPINTMMQAGVRRLLLISTPRDLPVYRELIGDGRRWGMEISYAEQPTPGGLAQAYQIGAAHVGGRPSALILGDNVFYGHAFAEMLAHTSLPDDGARVFAYRVKDPTSYGVIAFDEGGRAYDIEEKPKEPKSNFAVPGLYFFDGTAPERVRSLRPSARGELEITDLIRTYLDEGKLDVRVIPRGSAWLDTGTNEGMMQASAFIDAVQRRTGTMIGCPEETAYENGWIGRQELIEAARAMSGSDYGRYLEEAAGGGPA